MGQHAETPIVLPDHLYDVGPVVVWIVVYRPV